MQAPDDSFTPVVCHQCGRESTPPSPRRCGCKSHNHSNQLQLNRKKRHSPHNKLNAIALGPPRPRRTKIRRMAGSADPFQALSGFPSALRGSRRAQNATATRPHKAAARARKKVRGGVGAWDDKRNQQNLGATWRFRTAEARIKLNSLYPSVQIGPATSRRIAFN